MAKQRAIRNLYRYWSLIVFGCALLFFAPANRAEHSSLPFSAAPPVASPTVSPSPTAPSSDTKRPNVVRRFFSWVMHGFNRLFRRSRPLVISDPPLFRLRHQPLPSSFVHQTQSRRFVPKTVRSNCPRPHPLLPLLHALRRSRCSIALEWAREVDGGIFTKTPKAPREKASTDSSCAGTVSR